MSASKIELAKLCFKDGLPGFPDLEWFELTQEDQESPFFSLQSLEEEKVGFWLIDPFAYFKEYEFTLDEQTKVQLEITDESVLFIANIVTVQKNRDVTVNLKAPLVVNMNNCMAKQVILNEETYSLRQPLFQLQKKETSK